MHQDLLARRPLSKIYASHPNLVISISSKFLPMSRSEPLPIGEHCAVTILSNISRAFKSVLEARKRQKKFPNQLPIVDTQCAFRLAN